jgi:hypothetical protein
VCWAGDALRGLLAATALLRVFTSRVRSCLALAGWRLTRGRAAARLHGARLRGRAGLRGTRWVARGLRGSVATLAGLLIHHGPVRLRAGGVVSDRRALRLRRPIRLRAGGTVSHRRALRLRGPIRLRAGGTVSHRRTLRL